MGRTPEFRPLRVAVLAGGESAEREISLASGARVIEALAQASHTADHLDPKRVDLDRVCRQQWDICFLALHGGAGEDGRIQKRLDQLRMPYTGSGPDASWLAMCKSVAKERFRRFRVPTPEYVRLDQPLSPRRANIDVAGLGYPLIIKPEAQGSSLGVSVAHSAAELHDRLHETRRYGPVAIAERLIVGREFSVGVLERRPLPPVEIVGRGEIFDYHAKYASPLIEYRFDTALPPIIVQTLQQTAAAAATVLRTSGAVRVDLILDEDQKPWVLEVNTLPGMTRSSIVPKAAAQVGLDMAQLCDWMLQRGLHREECRVNSLVPEPCRLSA